MRARLLAALARGADRPDRLWVPRPVRRAPARRRRRRQPPVTLTIYFDNVLDLVPQSAVKVNDVPVGRVEDDRAERQERQLRRPAPPTAGRPRSPSRSTPTSSCRRTPAPRSSRPACSVRSTSTSSSRSTTPSPQPLKSGDTIPITRTGSAPEIEEVLGALSLLLNGGGLQQIQIITTELNKALDGNERAVRDLLTQLNTFVGTHQPADERDPRRAGQGRTGSPSR